MWKKLFFQGPIRIGKSTVLRDEINRQSVRVCGLTVQRVCERGQVMGYQAAVSAGALPPVDTAYRPGLPGVFLLRGAADLAALERVMTQTETKLMSANAELIFLDEIGGIELGSEIFMAALGRMLETGLPCIGILKSKQNLERTVAALRLQNTVLERHRELVGRIEQDGALVTVTKDTVGGIPAHAARFLEQFDFIGAKDETGDSRNAPVG